MSAAYDRVHMLHHGLIGRDDVLSSIHRSIVGRRHVVIRAMRGAGRTAVTEAVAGHHGTRLVRGRESVPTTPLVPFAHVIGELDPVPGGIQMYTVLPRVLLERSPVLVVDDADLLDTASASVVAQYIRAAGTVVLTRHLTGSLPGALPDLLVDADHVTLAPVTRRDMEEIIACRGSCTPLTPPTSARLWNRSQGNIRLALDLLDAAGEMGATTESIDGIHLTSFTLTDGGLASLGISQEDLRRHRDLVELLAVCGDLPAELLADHEVRAAVRARVAHLSADGAVGTTVALRDAVLSSLSLQDRAWVADRAIASMNLPADLEGLLTCLVDPSDRPVRDVVSTGSWLLDQDRFAEALEVLTGASGPWAELMRADVSAAVGDLDTARSHLAHAMDGPIDEPELLGVCDRWIEWHRGPDDRIDEVLGDVLPRLSAEGRSMVERRLVERALLHGERPPARAIIGDVTTTRLRAALSLPTEPVDSHAAPERRAPSGEDEIERVSRFLHLAFHGRQREARELLDVAFAEALETSSSSVGMWAYPRCKIVFHSGQLELAAERGLEMQRLLAWRDPHGLRSNATALFAACLARTGRHDDAEALLAELSPNDRELPRVALAVVRVEIEPGRHADPARAAAALWRAARHAEARGEPHSALLAVDEAFMLDPCPELTDRLESRRALSDLADAFAERARGLIDTDTERIARAAERLELMGQFGRAGHAWMQVARLLRRAQRRGDAATAEHRAARVLTQWGATPWPEEPPDAILTRRERGVALRAAAGERSRTIADALGVSVRTVDNHLARVYRKLGVAGRRELAGVFELRQES